MLPMAISQLPSVELTLGSTKTPISCGLFTLVMVKRSSFSKASRIFLSMSGAPLSVTTPMLSRLSVSFWCCLADIIAR